MSITTDLAAARTFIRSTLAGITTLAGYSVEIKSASGNQNENPIKAVDSALPKSWSYSLKWRIKRGPAFGTGTIQSPVTVDVWFDMGSDPGNGEEWEPYIDAIVTAFAAATAPARTKVLFDDSDTEGGITLAGRATLRIPMTIEVTYSVR